jgi:hypothetical protein
VTRSSTAPPEAQSPIEEIVQLLGAAYQQAWNQTWVDAPRFSLGLAIYLVRARVLLLLPVEYRIPDTEVDDRSVGQLLRDAEHRSRGVQRRHPDMAPMGDAAAILSDLIREADRLA